MRRARIIRSLVVLVAVLLGARTAQAEETLTEPWRLWGAVGFGSGGNAEDSGVAAMGEVVFQKAPHQLMARATGILDPYDPGSCDLRDIGLLYGRTAMGPYGHATLAAGLALTDAGCTPLQEDSNVTLGVPILGEAAFRPLPVLGIGLQMFVNFNSQARYGGGVLFLQLGWLPR